MTDEPLDEEYLRTFAAAQQAAANARTRLSDCAFCCHAFHGLRCAEQSRSTCECPSSFRAAS